MGRRSRTANPDVTIGRRAVGALAALTLAVAGALLAVPSADAATGRQASGQGSVRLPLDLTALGGVRFDPTTVRSPGDWYVQRLLYDTLLRQNADGSYSPGLAKSATVTDPQTIEIELRANVVFSDGTPFDAQAVKSGIERNIAAGNIAAFRTEINQVESITVASPTKLTIKLKTPIAGQFYNLLAHGETYIVSPTAVRNGTNLDENPVGAGPFDLESFTPERSAVFVKNRQYFQADRIQPARVEFVQVTTTDPQAVVNALLDNIVDAATIGSLDQATPLEAAGLRVITRASESSFILGPLCKDRPPFDDVRIRRALNYAIDRDEINELVYQGRGEPLWATWPKSSRLFNKELDGIYKTDLKRARRLLRQAGAQNLTFNFYAGPLPEQQRVAEILKQQWAEAGINANLVTFQNVVQEFFVEQKAPAGLVPLNRQGLDKVTRNLVPGSIGNFCNYDDPQLNALVQRIRELEAGSKEHQLAWWELDEYIVRNALHLFLVWAPNINAYNPQRLGDVSYRPDVFGVPRVDLFKVSVKQA